MGSARVCSTAMVCGWQSFDTKKQFRLGLKRANMAMASAAAVDSSKREALAISIPVISQTMVWKFKSASNLPWLISAW